MQRWMWVCLVVSGLAAAGCDGAMVEGEAAGLAVTEAAYSVATYEPPREGKDGDEYVAATVDFTSKDDVEKFASDHACEDPKASPLCGAVEPAAEVFESGLALQVCRKILYCKVCCKPKWGIPPVSCSTTCTLPDIFRLE